ncbi:sensor histidine kinase [Streptomyces sp. SCSIO 75703]|uniref:sensor histidine kinase n=1 Tax=unclassified Streptomyces TaxID=2593676 RepID=UPI00099DB3B9|nr:sensor histidine kinase [Streptomyces sp. NRRL F-5065]
MNALTPTPRALDWSLHLLVAGLLVLAAARAVADGGPHATAVVVVALVLGAVYALGPALPSVRGSRRGAALWLGAVGAVWLVLLALSAEGVWLAFPLYFVQLHLLPRRAGPAVVAATAVAASTAFAAHRGSLTAAVVIGPALGAAVAVAVVWGYQALSRESEGRRRLIEELTATRADLAEAQRAAGVLEERERLAREIHDTLAQGLSSIQLLLRAAERALPGRPERALTHVGQARQAAVDSLAEARRFVAALSPPALDDTTLADALDRLCATTGERHPLVARFRLTGRPQPLSTAREVALLRVAQSALGNTVAHADARIAEVALAYLDDAVVLRVGDDGVGFDPAAVRAPAAETGGFGLAAMRARVRAVGGTLTVESAPGAGTALTVRLPLGPDADRDPGPAAAAASRSPGSPPSPGSPGSHDCEDRP